eukprot:1599357-Amphidinium_carterae.1
MSQGGNYQKYMKQYAGGSQKSQTGGSQAGDYQKYMSQGGDYQKYMNDYASDYSKYMGGSQVLLLRRCQTLVDQRKVLGAGT